MQAQSRLTKIPKTGIKIASATYAVEHTAAMGGKVVWSWNYQWRAISLFWFDFDRRGHSDHKPHICRYAVDSNVYGYALG